MFFDFLGILPGGTMAERSKVFCDKAKSNNGYAFSVIVQYLQKLKERVEAKDMTAGTMKNRYQAVKLFCEMADITIAWKKISRGIPRVRNSADDRAPTIEEIRKIIEYPDRRIKAIVCTMVSSGIRVGAWDYLKWKHITPIERNGIVVAGKIIVYAGEEDEHFSFITPEAYHELHKWKEYRIHAGERLTNESWVMRNKWNTKKGYTRGLVTAPIKLQAEGVKRLVEDALWTQGVREKLEPGKKRHEFQTDHGFRKYFKTRCEIAGMKSMNIEILMDHSHYPRVSGSYYRISENELLEDYLRVVDELTIMDQRRPLTKVSNIGQKSNEHDHLLIEELRKKDNQIKDMWEKINEIEASRNEDRKEILQYIKRDQRRRDELWRSNQLKRGAAIIS